MSWCKVLFTNGSLLGFLASTLYFLSSALYATQGGLIYNGKRVYVNGANVLWQNKDVDSFKSDSALIPDISWYAEAFQQLRSQGSNTARIWVQADNSGTMELDQRGFVIGPDGQILSRLKSILDLADENQILVVLVLWDQQYSKIPVRSVYANRESLSSYIDNFLEPMVEKFKHHPALLGWDIINEPESLIESKNKIGTKHPSGKNDLLKFINVVAGTIRRTAPTKLITVGATSFRELSDACPNCENIYKDASLLKAGGHPLGYLDFYQVHYDSHRDSTEISPFHHPATYWQLYDKPILVGEIKNKGTRHLNPSDNRTLGEMFRYAFDEGYAGVLGWHSKDLIDIQDQEHSDLNQYVDALAGIKESIEGRQSDFVIADGTTLKLNGSPYRYAATNSFEMLFSEKAVDDHFVNMRDLKLTTLRFWGFWNAKTEKGRSLQTSPGEFNEPGWRMMDYVVWQAQQNGINLIVPLVNYWPEFGGVETYLKWGCAGGSQQISDFFKHDECKKWFKNYISYFLERVNTYTNIAYKNDPTFLIIEPINEIRGGAWGSDKYQTARWLDEMAAHIKSIDHNHLVGSGEEGFYEYRGKGFYDYPWNNKEGTDFILNGASPNIDVVSIHAWPFQWMLSVQPEDFMPVWIREHLIDAKKFNHGRGKPLYIGEFGYQITRKGNSNLEIRNRVMKSVFDYTLYGNDGNLGHHKDVANQLVGAGYWHMTASHDPGQGHGVDPLFPIYCPEDTSTCSLIRDFAGKMTVHNLPLK